jgi:hypothetical protein
MQTDLITRREQAIARHDKALELWPDRVGSGFAVELAAVADELGKIATALDAATADRLERSRTWRFAGDALFDLARGKDPEPLKRAAAAYACAEKLLDGIDVPVDHAKLNFNFANILRGLSQGQDRGLLEEALLRYQMALWAFRRHAPEHAATVQAALNTLQAQLEMLDAIDRVGAGYKSLRAAGDALARAPDDRGVQQRARELLESMKQRRSDLLRDAMSAVQDFGRQQTGAISEKLGAMIGQLQSSAGADDNPFQRLFPMLLARFQSEISAGRVSAERQAALEQILDELQKLINQPDTDLDGSIDRMGQLRQLMTRMTALLEEPSTGAPRPPAGSRRERTAKYEAVLAQHLSSEQLRPNLGSAERAAGRELFGELALVRSELAAVGTDAAHTIIAHERDLLRPLALRIEQFSLRHHVTVAHPFWVLPPTPPDPSGLYLCGASDCGPLLDQFADAVGLKRLQPGARTDAGQARFNAIAASRVVVCDLRLPPGPDLAAACYEIGIAKALGRALVILVAPDTTLPFDIEVAPLEVCGLSTDHNALAAAIDQALYSPPQREADSSLAETIAELHHRYGRASAFEVRKSIEFVQQAASDPIEAQRRIESLLGFIGPDAPRMIFPAWPGGYPEHHKPKLFHVMPFSLPWSNDVRDTVAAVCMARGVRYVRGDQVPDPRVIRSIWDEICRASHVLVDLSAFNANVALELGLVHGLGRHSLLVGQDDTVRQLFPAIRKVRVLPYALAGGGGTLRDAINRFIATDRPVV